jgi:hypothetical protein
MASSKQTTGNKTLRLTALEELNASNNHSSDLRNRAISNQVLKAHGQNT